MEQLKLESELYSIIIFDIVSSYWSEYHLPMREVVTQAVPP